MTVVAYDVPAITTGGRYWVDVTVTTPAGDRGVRWFVKVVHSFARSAEFRFVPEEVRQLAAASVPWRTEPLIYRSDLASRLPDGLRMPRAAAVVDLDEESAALWLEAIPARPRAWDDDQLVDTARRLGRLAAHPPANELASIGDPDGRFTAAAYRHNRLAHQIIPMLHDDGVWAHPLMTAAFDTTLRERLRAAAERIDDIVDELMAAPCGAAHGDACPNNLLTVDDHDDLVLIDFGFWSRQPLGFDLGQLVVGEIQLGRRAAATMPTLDPRVLAAYRTGLADAGTRIDAASLARLHACQLLVYTGLSAIPFEHFDRPVDAGLMALAHERATMTTFILDLVDATA